MIWKIELSASAKKSLKDMNPSVRRKIISYIENRIAPLENPRAAGKPLRGDLKEFWRYRIGDYRVICELLDSKVTILIMLVGHRSSIY